MYAIAIALMAVSLTLYLVRINQMVKVEISKVVDKALASDDAATAALRKRQIAWLALYPQHSEALQLAGIGFLRKGFADCRFVETPSEGAVALATISPQPRERAKYVVEYKQSRGGLRTAVGAQAYAIAASAWGQPRLGASLDVAELAPEDDERIDEDEVHGDDEADRDLKAEQARKDAEKAAAKDADVKRAKAEEKKKKAAEKAAAAQPKTGG